MAKKFRDCSWRELLCATKHQKQTRKSAGRVIRKAKTIADYAPKLPSPVLWRPLAMIGLGVVGALVADLLPSILGRIVALLALILTLGGIAELIRYFVSIRDRILQARAGGGRRAQTRVRRSCLRT